MNRDLVANCLERLVRLYERDEVTEGTLVGELHDLVYALRNNQGWPIGPTLGDYGPGQFEIGAALRDKREGGR